MTTTAGAVGMQLHLSVQAHVGSNTAVIEQLLHGQSRAHIHTEHTQY